MIFIIVTIASHFIENPVNGGSPASDSKIIEVDIERVIEKENVIFFENFSVDVLNKEII